MDNRKSVLGTALVKALLNQQTKVLQEAKFNITRGYPQHRPHLLLLFLSLSSLYFLALIAEHLRHRMRGVRCDIHSRERSDRGAPPVRASHGSKFCAMLPSDICGAARSQK